MCRYIRQIHLVALIMLAEWRYVAMLIHPVMHFVFYIMQLLPVTHWCTAFLAPILVIIFINTVIFIWVIVVVGQHAREKAAWTNAAISKKQILRMTISISGVLFLFGLTWLFFVLTVSVPGLRETFQILFTVFKSLQGFFAFAFILFTEGFDYWKAAFLSCHKSKPTQASNTSSKNKIKSTDAIVPYPRAHLRLHMAFQPLIMRWTTNNQISWQKNLKHFSLL